MTHFETFDSFEEMQASMAKAHEAAMERLTEHQKSLLPKRRFFWMSPRPELDLTIFGEYDLDSWLIKEEALTPDDERWMLPGHLNEMERRNLERGYKSGIAYSLWEPTGELGDTHVSMMWEISEAAFNQARAAGWDIPRRISDCPILRREAIEHITREMP